MKTIQNSELDTLIAAGKILEQDAHGPKVVLLAEHRYLKIFYHKSQWSMARLFSRATQFSRNAAKLKKRGITTVGILDTFKTKAPRRDCVLYHGVPGDTIRHQLQQHPQDLTLSRQIGGYIAHLHDAGVMFRSLHLGNIIQLPTSQLGLIDIADMRLNVFTLNNSQRRRNFHHVFRYQQDLDLIQLDTFIEGYMHEGGYGGKQKEYLEEAIRAAKPQVL